MNILSKENLAINIDDMLHKIEPFIRRIIREELEKVIKEKGNIFYLEPDMPLYEDIEEIVQRKSEKKIELYSDDEVWNV